MKTHYRLAKYLIIFTLFTTICYANQPNFNVFNTFYLDSNLGIRTLTTYSSNTFSTEESRINHKSPNEAFLYSLAIPGMGQLYTGAKYGYIYTAGEIALLTTYFILRNNAINTRDDYRQVVRDNVSFIGPGSFENWDLIEDFEHATQYENWNHVYDSENTRNRTGKWYWKDLDPTLKDEKDSEIEFDSKHRLEAFDLRKKANDTFQTARTIIGIVILNHVVSAVEARISTKRRNNKQTELDGFQFDVQTDVSKGSFSGVLVLRKTF